MRQLSWILVLFLTACTNQGTKPVSDMNTLLFTIDQERDVYDQSDYGEPPQFAVWLEDRKTGSVKTVFVTYRTGNGDFEGKTECPVSLPAWIGAFRKETGRDDLPTVRKPAPDAVTGATPKTPEFTVKTIVVPGSEWNYYVEVNVSGDYTDVFPSIKYYGDLDTQGNGQPSIIYKGEITATPGNRSVPQLIGRTEQLYLSTEINPDLEGIKNAREVFSRIAVSCIEGVSDKKEKEIIN